MMNQYFKYNFFHVLGAPSSSEWSIPELGIVGGHETNISLHPWQASLQRNGRHICGGALIADQWVLTSGHCLYENTLHEEITVRVGSTFYKNGGQLLKHKKLIIHEKFYFFERFENNIGLVQLESPATGPNIKPITLPGESDDLYNTTNFSVTGWGFSGENGTYNDVLQEVAIPPITLADCKADYNSTVLTRITEKMFCAGITGKGTCEADAGSPAVYKNQLLGVAAYTLSCAEPRLPTIFTRVSKFHYWIQYQIANSKP